MNAISNADRLLVIMHMADWDGDRQQSYERQWDCPTCDAVPGQKCRTVSVPSTALPSCHQTRRGLAWAELAETLRAAATPQ